MEWTATGLQNSTNGWYNQRGTCRGRRWILQASKKTSFSRALRSDRPFPAGQHSASQTVTAGGKPCRQEPAQINPGCSRWPELLSHRNRYWLPGRRCVTASPSDFNYNCIFKGSWLPWEVKSKQQVGGRKTEWSLRLSKRLLESVWRHVTHATRNKPLSKQIAIFYHFFAWSSFLIS